MNNPLRYTDPDGLEWMFKGDPTSNWKIDWFDTQEQGKKAGYHVVPDDQVFDGAYYIKDLNIVESNKHNKDFWTAFRPAAPMIPEPAPTYIYGPDAGPGLIEEGLNSIVTNPNSPLVMSFVAQNLQAFNAFLDYQTMGFFSQQDYLLGRLDRGTIDSGYFWAASFRNAGVLGGKVAVIAATAGAAAPLAGVGSAGPAIAGAVGGGASEITVSMYEGRRPTVEGVAISAALGGLFGHVLAGRSGRAGSVGDEVPASPGSAVEAGPTIGRTPRPQIQAAPEAPNAPGASAEQLQLPFENLTDDALYSRGTFRQSADAAARAGAPRNASSEMICPTCGIVIPERITIQTRNGQRWRIGYDRDHFPDTWAQRVEALRSRVIRPLRREVLDEYNRDLRVQCPPCNQSHQFEGVPGTFTGVPQE